MGSDSRSTSSVNNLTETVTSYETTTNVRDIGLTGAAFERALGTIAEMGILQTKLLGDGLRGVQQAQDQVIGGYTSFLNSQATNSAPQPLPSVNPDPGQSWDWMQLAFWAVLGLGIVWVVVSEVRR